VILRFTHPSGVPPKGKVTDSMPQSGSDAHRDEEFEIRDGEVRFDAMTGRSIHYSPGKTVGYWFQSGDLREVPEGTEPLIIDIPVVPAGFIYVTARTADGRPAEGIFCSIVEVKRSPLVTNVFGIQESHLSSSGSSVFSKGPLPLGGTYVLVGSLNGLRCASEEITLTEAAPDREVLLTFPKGEMVEGRVLFPDGSPAADLKVEATWRFRESHGFGLKAESTDETGRFRFDSVNGPPGTLQLIIQGNPDFKPIRVPVDFNALPIRIVLERGLRVEGRVVHATSGLPMAGAEVVAYQKDGQWGGGRARTDSDGQFVLTTLDDATYRLLVVGSNLRSDSKAEAKGGQADSITLVAQPY
jgi:hypothetical protein